MKKLMLIFLLLGTIACDKEDENEYANMNLNCIEKVTTSAWVSTLTSNDRQRIDLLFTNNGIVVNHFEPYEFIPDSLGYSHIKGFQYVNSLRVFTNNLIYHFNKEDQYYSLSGDLINEVYINSEAKSSLSSMENSYGKALAADSFLTNELVRNLVNECFTAELGYYNLNAGRGYAPENFVLAWLVKPVNKEYPFAYINDNNQEVIYYDNGLRFMQGN